VELGHNLGLRVVAEGVEREEDWIGLQMLGCDVAQGYFLGRPMPPEAVIVWLEASGRGVSPRARVERRRNLIVRRPG
jgi:EAL domain-containing protein (putative c-di-GMP-specific phosphodiesterase class I)